MELQSNTSLNGVSIPLTTRKPSHSTIHQVIHNMRERPSVKQLTTKRRIIMNQQLNDSLRVNSRLNYTRQSPNQTEDKNYINDFEQFSSFVSPRVDGMG